jgi:tRNA (adenine57-N1/adenine58-N1)-methyltransferase
VKVIQCGDRFGTLDSDNFTVSIHGKTFHLARNSVIDSGDTLRINREMWQVLDFNPSLFPAVSDRKAQIIQTHDAAYILAKSGIHTGSNVVESGVGSGALTAHLLWAIGNTGNLTSIDTDAERLKVAGDGLSRFFDLANWHPVNGRMEYDHGIRGYDACILDVPNPWDSLSVARKYLRSGGILVAYCPNFNQSERFVTDAGNAGFMILETVELELRKIIVRPGSTRPDSSGLIHTGFITVGINKGNSVTEIVQ